MNLPGGSAIETVEDTVKIAGASALCSFAQSLAQLFRTLRAWKKSLQQGAQIESRSADDDGQMMARLNLLDHLPRLARIFAGRDVASWRYVIEQMMGGAGSFGGSGLGGADIKLAVHGDRIAVHDLAMEMFCERQGKCGLPTGRGTNHNHEQRFRRHR